MPGAEPLWEDFLAQSPACHWILDEATAFFRIYGDLEPIFGKPASELSGRTLTEALDADAAALWKHRFTRALQGEAVHLREPRGDSLWCVTLFPMRLEGEIRYVGGLADEITQWSTAEQELRYTVHGALKAQEFERAMVARFLHDSVGQNLTALGLQLDLVRMDLENAHPEACARVSEIQRILGNMMEQVRDYSYELNPATVERAGLRFALDRLTCRMRRRFTGSVRLNVDPSLKLDSKIATAMFGIAQEAMENAVQHAGCSAIEIAVKSTRTGSFLEIRDNGRGFDPADLHKGRRGLGLLSMEYHAAEAGLDLTISSNVETGTTVRAAAQEPD